MIYCPKHEHAGDILVGLPQIHFSKVSGTHGSLMPKSFGVADSSVVPSQYAEGNYALYHNYAQG